MCLILFGFHASDVYPLIVAANRDEFHGRESAPAQFWDDHKQVLAGRDLVAGGTWLGCTTGGRFAALTNFSGPDDAPAVLSRGLLVQEFLTGTDSAVHYGHNLHGPDYAGFNLLLYDGEHMVYTSNKGTTDILHPGFYGLSNAELGAEWPKCVRGAAGLQQITEAQFDSADLIGLLHDSDIPADDQLPHRGRPVELERRVAPSFIVGDEYGTRASTSVIMTRNQITFTEQSYLAGGISAGLVDFAFDIPAC
jgi:uncharacterized protein with NRDE domain